MSKRNLFLLLSLVTLALLGLYYLSNQVMTKDSINMKDVHTIEGATSSTVIIDSFAIKKQRDLAMQKTLDSLNQIAIQDSIKAVKELKKIKSDLKDCDKIINEVKQLLARLKNGEDAGEIEDAWMGLMDESYGACQAKNNKLQNLEAQLDAQLGDF